MPMYRYLPALLAILFSASALGEQPAGESRFAALDTDGDGQLSAAELGQLPTRGHMSADERFARLDSDNSGFVTRQELHQARERRREHRPDFTDLDTDGDGQLSAAELGQLPVRGHMSADERFARLDGDNSGFVTRQELHQARERRREHRPDFTDLDTDGDGQLSAAELGQLPARGHMSADERFAHLDANADGYVSRDELQTAPGRRPR